jgi:hypothetical protein
MDAPIHNPDADDLRELCGLAAALRAWAHTHGDEYDPGREHALYPPRQYRAGLGANEGPLWRAIERVLIRNGYGKNGG